VTLRMNGSQVLILRVALVLASTALAITGAVAGEVAVAFWAGVLVPSTPPAGSRT